MQRQPIRSERTRQEVPSAPFILHPSINQSRMHFLTCIHAFNLCRAPVHSYINLSTHNIEIRASITNYAPNLHTDAHSFFFLLSHSDKKGATHNDECCLPSYQSWQSLCKRTRLSFKATGTLTPIYFKVFISPQRLHTHSSLSLSWIWLWHT